MNISSAHIFNPVDDTLEARIRALKEVISAYRNLKDSESKVTDEESSRRIGSKEELASAKEVIESSILKAKKSLSSDDLKKATERDLVSNEDLKHYISAQRSIEQRSSSKRQKASSSHKM